MAKTKNKFKILNVVGTRPNFVKIAPLVHAMQKMTNIEQVLVHTGQHYDNEMNNSFFQSLNVPNPDYNLSVSGGTNEFQIAEIMKKFEPVLLEINPDLVLVVGDVNSTVACAKTAKKNGFKVAHVESGLRSFDNEMPEEINRVATDKISDYLFTTEKTAMVNLTQEGIESQKVFFTGNVMIDALVSKLPIIETSNVIQKLSLEKKKFFLLTLHRPSNVDSADGLSKILNGLESIEPDVTIVFAAHPRTIKMIEQFKIKLSARFKLIGAQPYIDFLNLTMNAKAIFTDSGGVQEESTFLKVPCITLRKNTERPVTIDSGTNVLALEINADCIQRSYKLAMDKTSKVIKAPDLWDGKAAERIVNILIEQLSNADQ